MLIPKLRDESYEILAPPNGLDIAVVIDSTSVSRPSVL